MKQDAETLILTTLGEVRTDMKDISNRLIRIESSFGGFEERIKNCKGELDCQKEALNRLSADVYGENGKTGIKDNIHVAINNSALANSKSDTALKISMIGGGAGLGGLLKFLGVI